MYWDKRQREGDRRWPSTLIGYIIRKTVLLLADDSHSGSLISEPGPWKDDDLILVLV